jgi:phenylacetate-CoA ligase
VNPVIAPLYWSAYLAWHARGQARFPFLPYNAIERVQARRVRQIVAYAYRHIPYYRDEMGRLGLTPDDFAGFADLAKLPILERWQLQRDPERFAPRQQPAEGYLTLRSGGSTGESIFTHHDIGDVLQNAAHGERERPILCSLIGGSRSYREAVLTSNNGIAARLQSFSREKAPILRAARTQRLHLLVTDPPAHNIPLLNAFQPDVLNSFGSYLEALFPYIKETGAEFFKPKVVTYSSEALSGKVRRLIEDEFGIPVLSTYQATEVFRIGFECLEHRGLHLNTDLFPLRIVGGDGATLPAGESGEVVISNLVNRGTVVLNYRLGDLATILPDPCPCGRRLPLLSFPEGRADDWVQLASGERLHPQAIRDQLSGESGLWRYQVTQEALHRFHIDLVASEDCDRAQLTARLQDRFARLLGEGVTVRIALVDELARTPGGKIRAVRSWSELSAKDATP